MVLWCSIVVVYIWKYQCKRNTCIVKWNKTQQLCNISFLLKEYHMIMWLYCACEVLIQFLGKVEGCGLWCSFILKAFLILFPPWVKWCTDWSASIHTAEKEKQFDGKQLDHWFVIILSNSLVSDLVWRLDVCHIQNKCESMSLVTWCVKDLDRYFKKEDNNEALQVQIFLILSSCLLRYNHVQTHSGISHQLKWNLIDP